MLRASELRFLDELRNHLDARRKVQPGRTKLVQLFEKTMLSQSFWGFALTAYQPGCQRVMVVRIQNVPAVENIRKVVNQMLKHERVDEFDFSDHRRCRVQIDFIEQDPVAVELHSLSDHSLESDRFEIGVEGLRIVQNGRRRYVLPGDAFVWSILSLNQLRRHIGRLFPGADIDKLECYRFRTQSCISWNDGWLPLYRGIPVIGEASDASIEAAAKAGVAWILRTMKPDGQVEYYYDATTDTGWDHQHPKRDPITNPYYNLLRHCGGVVTALWYYEHTDDQSLKPYIESMIGFYVKQLITYQTSTGTDAAYAYYNKKAKLGGSGLGLLMLGTYQRLFRDQKYADTARQLAEHLVNEIQQDGEFRYYYVYLDKKVSLEQNPKLFSFYYPGEALIGLASYCQHVCVSSDDKTTIYREIHKALRFLLINRPKLYKEHYQSLPSDSWLMMAVNDFWDLSEFQDDLYKQFVFTDADQMIAHMYTEGDAIFPDYVGSFYYDYGDHAYPDGARAEGLLAAYFLARKSGDQLRTERYHEALRRLMWATLHLCNTPESVYSVPNPEHAIGGIRFKLTRQWFRVDTIQHVACFYLKYLLSKSQN